MLARAARSFLSRLGVLQPLERQTSRLERRVDELESRLADAAREQTLRLDRLERRSTDHKTASAGVEVRLSELEEQTRLWREVAGANGRDAARWESLLATLDTARIEPHVRRAVQRSALVTTPMAHIVVRDLLPGDTYAALLDAIPPEACFPTKDMIKQNLKVSRLRVAPDWTHRAWTHMEDVVIPRMIVPALADRFQGVLAALGIDEPIVATEGRLMLRRPGYHLDPHLDPSRAVITCLLYFARPGDDESFGTDLYRLDRPPAVDQSKTFYPARNGYACTLETSVPFAPNTLLAFLNRDGAHGAQIPQSAPASTRRHSYQFYLSPASQLDPGEA